MGGICLAKSPVSNTETFWVAQQNPSGKGFYGLDRTACRIFRDVSLGRTLQACLIYEAPIGPCAARHEMRFHFGPVMRTLSLCADTPYMAKALYTCETTKSCRGTPGAIAACFVHQSVNIAGFLHGLVMIVTWFSLFSVMTPAERPGTTIAPPITQVLQIQFTTPWAMRQTRA